MDSNKTSRSPKHEGLSTEESTGEIDSSAKRLSGNRDSSDVEKHTPSSGSPIARDSGNPDSSDAVESTGDFQRLTEKNVDASASLSVQTSTGGSDSPTDGNSDNPGYRDEGKSTGDPRAQAEGHQGTPGSPDAGKSVDSTGIQISPGLPKSRAADINAVKQVVQYALELAAEEAPKIASQAVPTAGSVPPAKNIVKIEKDVKIGAASKLLKLAFVYLNDETTEQSPSAMPEKEDAGKGEVTETGGPGYSLADMKRLQTIFAEQAFNFLLKNYQVFEFYPKFARDLPDRADYNMCFTHDVGQALVLIAYVNRCSYRKIFRLVKVRDVRDYRRVVSSRDVPKDDAYFYHFLNWVAFSMDFTVFCLKNGHDFIEVGKLCIANYRDLEYFHAQGGWGRLIEDCYHIAGLYDKISVVASLERPTDEALVPFLKMVEIMEKDAHARRAKWMLTQPEMRTVRQIRQNLLKKYEVLDSLDKHNVTSGFRVRRRAVPRVVRPLEEACPAAAEFMRRVGYKKSPQKEREEKEVERLAATLELTRIQDETGRDPDEVRAAHKYEFLVSERFMERREKKKWSPRRRRGQETELIRLTSPGKQDAGMSAVLGERLEEGLESRNYLPVGNDLYLVTPTGSDAEESTVTVILDTESEDELDEDEDEAFASLSEAERMRRMNQMIRSVVMSKSAQLTESLVGDGSRPDLPGLSGEAAAPTPDTGAIPKQPRPRKNSKRKTPVTSPEKADKDSSDPSNAPEDSNKTSPKKSPRRRKKK